jgi:hypothetical protein
MSVSRTLLTALLICNWIPRSQDQTVQITGIYSSLHYVEGSGDLLGTEIIVSRVGTGYEVHFQEAEGAPSRVRSAPAVVKGDSLFFQLPPDTLQVWQGSRVTGTQVQPGRFFRARISATGLRGRFAADVTDRMVPRRQRSHWNK